MAIVANLTTPFRLKPSTTASPLFLHSNNLKTKPIRFPKMSVSSTTIQTDDDKEVVLLKKGISELYDESSGIWEDIWGEHMHHGFYDSGDGSQIVSLTDHRSAQLRMIEESLRFAGLSGKKPKRIVDVGCGIGGSSRYLAKKYGAKCCGITLSPVQAKRAQALSAAQGLSDQVKFQVGDALNQPFADGEFDLVWSMESGEHMPNKSKFVSELVRVAAPGATIIIVTWCHRDLGPEEKSLKEDEKALLEKICKSYYLPEWCSAADYVNLLESLNLQEIKRADWSANVAPFWPAVIRTALTWKGITSLLRSGWKSIKGALAMPLMIEGYKKDLIKFAIITSFLSLVIFIISMFMILIIQEIFSGSIISMSIMPQSVQHTIKGFLRVLGHSCNVPCKLHCCEIIVHWL